MVQFHPFFMFVNKKRLLRKLHGLYKNAAWEKLKAINPEQNNYNLGRMTALEEVIKLIVQHK